MPAKALTDVARLEACGARSLGPDSAEYPPSLDQLTRPCRRLFVRGSRLDVLGHRVSVVGARKCSRLGSQIAEDIGKALAQGGATVVSGGAYGIDAAAHRGALEAGGSTMVVLGGGIDQLHPPSNKRLFERVLAGGGAIISEHPPGVPSLPENFPVRNRIIAALSRALVVVEGAERSGTHSTTLAALELGREVYAVPGAVNQPLAETPLKFIREGATMIRGPEDLLDDLGLTRSPDAFATAMLSLVEERVLEQVKGPTLPERIAAEMNCSIAEIVPVLMSLEMKGVLVNSGGRVDRRRRIPVGVGEP